MNKTLKVILNILIVIASIVFVVCFFYLISSIRYANREVEDPSETYKDVFEYEIKHRAYGEVMGNYYVRRMDNFDPPAGFEDLYRVGEYGHTAFMSRVCDENDDKEKATLYREKAERLRSELGAYEYTADEMDKMMSRRMKGK